MSQLKIRHFWVVGKKGNSWRRAFECYSIMALLVKLELSHDFEKLLILCYDTVVTNEWHTSIYGNIKFKIKIERGMLSH